VRENTTSITDASFNKHLDDITIMASRRKDATKPQEQKIGFQAVRHRSEASTSVGCDARDCTSEVFLRCKRCGIAKYCSTACMKQDWTEKHNRVCGKITESEHEKQRNLALVHDPVPATSTSSDKELNIAPMDKDVVDPRGQRYFENM
jgi:hypothetical protein